MIRKRWWVIGAAAAALLVSADARPEQPTPAPQCGHTGEIVPAATAKQGPTSTQTKTYAVADLVIPLPMDGDPPKAKPDGTTEHLLMQMIPNLIAPGTWAPQGGSGTLDYFPLTMSLVVNHTPAVQEQVARFLDVLRSFEPMEFAIEMRLGKGCDETHQLPKVTVYDGQRFHFAMEHEELLPPRNDNGPSRWRKVGFDVEMQAMRIDGDRIGVSLNVRTSDAGRAVEVRAVRDAKFDEPFKVKLGEPANGEPVRWIEVVVHKVVRDEERQTGYLPPTQAAPETAQGERLVPVPATTLVASDPGVVQASYNTKPKKPAKDPAKVTMKLSAGDDLSLKTVGGRVVVEGKELMAHADRATAERGGDALLLEGDVRLKYHKGDRQGSVSANRLRISLKDGSVDLEPDASTAAPSSPCHSWSPKPDSP